MFTFRMMASVLVVLSLAGWGCGPGRQGVAQYGAMRDVLHHGRAEARVRLVEATRMPHAYGVGALENLAGEITIVDGSVWVARRSGDDLSVSGPAVVESDRATLLTLSHVAAWQGVELTQPLDTEALEHAVESVASAHQVDTRKPFPFVIVGKLTELDAHVIAGSCPHSANPGSVEPWRLSLRQPAKATLVGFFARGKAGVMTHHDSLIHMHVVMKSRGQTITAHVDRVVVDSGSMLRVPHEPDQLIPPAASSN